MTRGVKDRVPAIEIWFAISRHLSGDWGDVCETDGKLNDKALTTGARLVSIYKTSFGLSFWIITEADRSITTVLLPEEY